MIDIEKEVFSRVAKRVREKYKNIYIVGEMLYAPARWPAVFIEETYNSIYERMRTAKVENFAVVKYDVRVYSNKASGRKQEAKDIFMVVDGAFSEMGFTRRTMFSRLADETIYCITATYDAIVDEDFFIYQL